MVGVGDARTETVRAAEAIMLVTFMMNVYTIGSRSLNLVKVLQSIEICADEDGRCQEKRAAIYINIFHTHDFSTT